MSLASHFPHNPFYCSPNYFSFIQIFNQTYLYFLYQPPFRNKLLFSEPFSSKTNKHIYFLSLKKRHTIYAYNYMYSCSKYVYIYNFLTWKWGCVRMTLSSSHSSKVSSGRSCNNSRTWKRQKHNFQSKQSSNTKGTIGFT